MDMTELAIPETAHKYIDQLELVMLDNPDLLIDMPLTHRFTEGMYIREIFNPAGALLTTKIHKTEHPFVVLKGKISVYVPGEEVKHIQAPYLGITKAGTRRIIFAYEDTVFVTFHTNPDNEQNIDVLEDRLFAQRELIDGKAAYELSQGIIRARQIGDR